MKVAKLKELISDLDDNLDVIIVNEDENDNISQLMYVRSAGIIKHKFEDCDALGLTCSNYSVEDIAGGMGYDVDLIYSETGNSVNIFDDVQSKANDRCYETGNYTDDCECAICVHQEDCSGYEDEDEE